MVQQFDLAAEVVADQGELAARLRYDSEAVLHDLRPDPAAPPRADVAPPQPEALERGPIIVPATLRRLDEARDRFGRRVQGILVGDRETMGLMEVADDIHGVREGRRHGPEPERGGFSPVHSKSLTALYCPNALSGRAARHQPRR